MTNLGKIQPSESGSQASSGGFSSQTGKRKQIGDEVNNGGSPATPVDPARKMSKPNQDDNGSASAPPISVVQKKARETRLEQNRKAARESRRRKKVMIEDLQKSVIFFSRANGALKHQNDELTRLLMQAQAQVSVLESATNANSNGNNSVSDGTSSATSSNPAQRHPQQPQPPPHPHQQQQQQQQPNSTIELPATNPATTTPSSQPVIHSGVPTSAASQLHQAYPTFPVMQPGATMQAMASFQQAAAAAMQVAVQGMQGISPGVSLTSLAQTSPSSGQSASQVYNDTMTALAMQQAAAAAAAVPPHLVAQMMGTTGASNGWTMAAAAAAANGTAPVTILPAPKGVSTLLPAPLAPNPTQVVPVAPVPASMATTTPPGEQRTE